MKYLIKQAKIIPLLFFIPVFIAGALVKNYNSILQHASEITLTNFYTAKLILNSGAIATGLSCIVLAIGILLNFNSFKLSSLLLFLFGVSMISNGIYPMGSMMHGLYGIGLVFMILPFITCYELKHEINDKMFFKISLVVGFITFIYFWSMLVGLDPANYKGLTQRIASLFIFGWISFLSYKLSKKL